MFTEKNIKTVLIISELTLKIQALNLGHVFIDYSGHVNQISVRIYTGEWSNEANDEKSYQTINSYLENTRANNERLSKIIYFLQECILKNEILNFENLDYPLN